MSNRLQKIREEKNLTQMELAEKAGISLRTLQRIEAGQIPKGFTLKALSQALEIQPDELKDVNAELEIDVNRLKLINISCLAFMILPFGNLLIPGILTYKTKNKATKNLAKSILEIQIIWTVLFSLAMIFSPLIQKSLGLKIPLIFLSLGCFFLGNLYIIFKNARQINQNGEIAIRLNSSIL